MLILSQYMGKIIIHENNNENTIDMEDSISMFNWQYELQKKLQIEK